MKWKRLGRSMACLLLASVLMFNVCSIPARADAHNSIETLTNSEIVIGSILWGLGLTVGAMTVDEMRDSIDEMTTDLQGNSLFADLFDRNQIKIMTRATEDGKVYGSVAKRLVEGVWNWLFDSGTVDAGTYNRYYTSAACSSFEEALAYASKCEAAYVGYSSDKKTKYVIVTSDNSEYVKLGDNGTLIIYGYGVNHSVWYEGCSTWQVKNSSSNYYYYNCYSLATSPQLTTSKNWVVDSLLHPRVGFATGYADWAKTTQQLENDKGEIEDYVDLGIGQTLEETLEQTQDEVWSGVTTLTQDTTQLGGTTWAKFTTWLSGQFKALMQGPAQILELLSTWPAHLMELLGDLLVTIFVPQQDFLTEKVLTLRSEFGFADSVIGTAEFIRDIFTGVDPSPPVIWIDLAATRGSYNIGGKVKFIDMNWYAEYKPTVDKLLSALILIVFCWRTYKRLPGIISGVPGDFVMDGLHSVGLDNHLPTRNAAYEIQRRDVRDSIRRGK